MVVQFGLAMIRFGAVSASAPLTSATTSGTSGSIRQAKELSMTVTPAAANFGASALDVDPPAEKRAMSSPVGSAVSASSTTTSAPAHGNVLPAERADAKYRISSTGNDRCARMRRIMAPTCPVAPTTPTLHPPISAPPLARWTSSAGAAVDDGFGLLGAEFEGVVDGPDRGVQIGV